MFSSWKIGKKFNFGGSNHEKHEKQHQKDNKQQLDETVQVNSKPADSTINSANDRRQTIVATPQSVAPVRLSTDVPRPSMDSTRTNQTQSVITTTNELASDYSSLNVSGASDGYPGNGSGISNLSSHNSRQNMTLNDGTNTSGVFSSFSTSGQNLPELVSPTSNSSSSFSQDFPTKPQLPDSSFGSSSSSSSSGSSSNGNSNEQQFKPEETATDTQEGVLGDEAATSSSPAGIMTIKIYSGDSFKLPFPIIYDQQLLSRLIGSSNSKQSPNLMEDLNKYMEILNLNSNTNNNNNGNSNTNNGMDDCSISSSQSGNNIRNDPAQKHSMNSFATNGNENENPFKANNQENIIPGDVATHYIPAAITLPGATASNPLIYFTIEFDNTTATIEPESGSMNHPVFNKISTFDITRKLPFLKIDVFCKIPAILIPKNLLQNATNYNEFDNNNNNNNNNNNSDSTANGYEMINKIANNEDVHLITYNLPLNLNFTSASNIRIFNHKWIALNELGTKLNLTIDYKPLTNKKLSIDDFELLKVIGKGSFGKVMQVRKKDTQKIYALKAIRKSYIVSNSEVTHTLAERTVLAHIQCPFIVPLKFSFQSKEKLYLVLALINGGELFFHLQKEGRFTLSRSRFYAAELLIALESLHDLNVIYRDLKPENILLDYQGHIALCDFGLCKLDMKNKDKTSTFCGTPEYLAPELLLGEGYTRVVDWWTLGVLLYEMLTGLPPYYDDDVPKMYKKILQEPLRFPEGFDEDAKDLLVKLLNRDPKKRLGSNGSQEIKSHAFFSQLSWKRLTMKGYIPPYKPPVQNSLDTSNFDSEFTKEKPVDSVVCDFLSESVQQQFGGWTYVGNEQLDAGSVAPK